MGFPLCIGPAGIRAGETFFPWADKPGDIGSRIAPSSQPATDDAETKLERLSARAWCAISGGAASTGMGRLSGTDYAMLAWLFNARLGCWWRTARAMMSPPRRSSPWGGTFDLVYQEFLARFYGETRLTLESLGRRAFREHRRLRIDQTPAAVYHLFGQRC